MRHFSSISTTKAILKEQNTPNFFIRHGLFFIFDISATKAEKCYKKYKNKKLKRIKKLKNKK